MAAFTGYAFTAIFFTLHSVKSLKGNLIMIGYITLGTNDISKAVDFYDKIFDIIDAKKIHDYDRFVGWSLGESDQVFAVAKPFNGEEATYGNGTMIALKLKNQQDVEQCYAKALELGGTNEGEPGVRQGSYFCAYCRDLDGNKLNFYYQL
jgi:predicted lactoylglutathione lyase